MIRKQDIQKCAEFIREAECVLIGAGAGITVDAGYDYTDREAFSRDYPGMARRGFRMKAELIGYTGWSPVLKWGYLAAHVNQVRFESPCHPVYGRLLDLVKDKDYFVMTSNVDGMFAKNGFSEDKVFTPQGDYAFMQCETPCRRETWDIKPVIDRILPAIDPETQEIIDPGVIPTCPNCGGPVFMNVRAAHWFIDDPYREQAARFSEFIQGRKESRLLLIEIGAGFNTPSVIRWPMERITHSDPDAKFIRINPQWPQVPDEIAEKSVTFKKGAMETITGIWEAAGKMTI